MGSRGEDHVCVPSAVTPSRLALTLSIKKETFLGVFSLDDESLLSGLTGLDGLRQAVGGLLGWMHNHDTST